MENIVFNQPTEPVIGLPSAGDLTSVEINQGYPDTCAIRSQEIIMRDFGIDISQEELIAESMAHGWYNPNGGGTNPADVGNLLELHGIGVEKIENASMEDLVNNLAQGRRIIVGVDSGELWEGGPDEALEDLILGEHADHALVVAGIDTTDPSDPQVVLTDPGTGHVAKSYPLDQFMDAWQDSGCYMVATDHPAPISAAGMANFDYAEGHLPFIGDQPFDSWLEANAENISEPFYHTADMEEGFGASAGSAMIDLDGDGHTDVVLDPTVSKVAVQAATVIDDVKKFVSHVDDILDGRDAVSGSAAIDLDGDGFAETALNPGVDSSVVQVATVMNDMQNIADDVMDAVDTAVDVFTDLS